MQMAQVVMFCAAPYIISAARQLLLTPGAEAWPQQPPQLSPSRSCGLELGQQKGQASLPQRNHGPEVGDQASPSHRNYESEARDEASLSGRGCDSAAPQAVTQALQALLDVDWALVCRSRVLQLLADVQQGRCLHQYTTPPVSICIPCTSAASQHSRHQVAASYPGSQGATASAPGPAQGPASAALSKPEVVPSNSSQLQVDAVTLEAKALQSAQAQLLCWCAELLRADTFHARTELQSIALASLTACAQVLPSGACAEARAGVLDALTGLQEALQGCSLMTAQLAEQLRGLRSQCSAQCSPQQQQQQQQGLCHRHGGQASLPSKVPAGHATASGKDDLCTKEQQLMSGIVGQEKHAWKQQLLHCLQQYGSRAAAGSSSDKGDAAQQAGARLGHRDPAPGRSEPQREAHRDPQAGEVSGAGINGLEALQQQQLVQEDRGSCCASVLLCALIPLQCQGHGPLQAQSDTASERFLVLGVPAGSRTAGTGLGCLLSGDLSSCFVDPAETWWQLLDGAAEPRTGQCRGTEPSVSASDHTSKGADGDTHWSCSAAAVGGHGVGTSVSLGALLGLQRAGVKRTEAAARTLHSEKGGDPPALDDADALSTRSSAPAHLTADWGRIHSIALSRGRDSPHAMRSVRLGRAPPAVPHELVRPAGSIATALQEFLHNYSGDLDRNGTASVSRRCGGESGSGGSGGSTGGGGAVGLGRSFGSRSSSTGSGGSAGSAGGGGAASIDTRCSNESSSSSSDSHCSAGGSGGKGSASGGRNPRQYQEQQGASSERLVTAAYGPGQACLTKAPWESLGPTSAISLPPAPHLHVQPSISQQVQQQQSKQSQWRQQQAVVPAEAAVHPDLAATAATAVASASAHICVYFHTVSNKAASGPQVPPAQSSPLCTNPVLGQSR